MRSRWRVMIYKIKFWKGCNILDGDLILLVYFNILHWCHWGCHILRRVMKRLNWIEMAYALFRILHRKDWQNRTKRSWMGITDIMRQCSSAYVLYFLRFAIFWRPLYYSLTFPTAWRSCMHCCISSLGIFLEEFRVHCCHW